MATSTDSLAERLRARTRHDRVGWVAKRVGIRQAVLRAFMAGVGELTDAQAWRLRRYLGTPRPHPVEFSS